MVTVEIVYRLTADNRVVTSAEGKARILASQPGDALHEYKDWPIDVVDEEVVETRKVG